MKQTVLVETPVSEKPEKDGKYLCIMPNGNQMLLLFSITDLNNTFWWCGTHEVLPWIWYKPTEIDTEARFTKEDMIDIIIHSNTDGIPYNMACKIFNEKYPDYDKQK